MDKAVFNKFRQIVYEKSGISLSAGKEALVSARVGKRMRALGIEDHREYLRLVTQDDTGEELVQLLDAISTNVTSFYRESNHFEFLTEVLRKWAGGGQRRFRLWSAACSSGEEPYTMAITVCEALGLDGYDIRILGTDISTRILRRCVAGVYSKGGVKTVPGMLRDRYFDRQREGDEVLYAVKQQLKAMVLFRRLNLSLPPFSMHGPLDVVFCRNVMIYFDNTVRTKLLKEISRLLRPGGYLFVGHAESLTGLVSSFKPVKPSIYVKPA